MTKKEQRANEAYRAAIIAIREAGLNPLDYALSYVRGFMDGERITEYRAEFEAVTVEITITANGTPAANAPELH